MYIRWDKANPPKNRQDFRYAKLVKSYKQNGKVKHKVFASLGKVQYSNGEILSRDKVRMLVRLISVVAFHVNNLTKKDINTLLNSEKQIFQFTPYEKRIYSEFYDMYEIRKKNLLEGIKDTVLFQINDSFNQMKLKANYKEYKELQVFDDILSTILTIKMLLFSIKLSILSDQDLVLYKNLIKNTPSTIITFQKKLDKEIKRRNIVLRP